MKFLISLIFIYFFTLSLYSIDYERLKIQSEIDTNSVRKVLITNKGISVYTSTSAFVLKDNLEFVSKGFEVDTSSKLDHINDANYFKDNYYLNVYGNYGGLIVLDESLEELHRYNRENSKLEYNKTCASYYDEEIRYSYFLTCTNELFVIKDNGEQIYSRDESFPFTTIYSFNIYNDYYHLSFYCYEEDIVKTVKTDKVFNVIEEIDFVSEFDVEYNKASEIFNLDDYIGFKLSVDGNYNHIIYTHDLKEYIILEDEIDEIDSGVINIRSIDDKLFVCTNIGIFIYDVETNTYQHIELNDLEEIESSHRVYDVIKYQDKYLASTGYGLVLIDTEITHIERKESENDSFELKDGIFYSKGNNYEIQIYNVNSKLIRVLKGEFTYNIDKYITASGYYFLIITGNNNTYFRKYLKF